MKYEYKYKRPNGQYHFYCIRAQCNDGIRNVKSKVRPFSDDSTTSETVHQQNRDRVAVVFFFCSLSIQFRNSLRQGKKSILETAFIIHTNIFRHYGSVLFCLVCDENVNAKQSSQIAQLLHTAKHIGNLKRKTKGTKTQSLLTTFQTPAENSSASEFAMDLSRAFLESNIALRMKRIAAGKYLWVSIDETTDVEQRYIANLIFGIIGESGRSYLFASKVLDATNSNTIASFFDQSINELNIDKNKVLLIVTGAAPYMMKAMRSLNVLYPKMIHVTCLAHGLHRVADFIRTRFSDVNDLISSVKKIFRKVLNACILIRKFPNIYPYLLIRLQLIDTTTKTSIQNIISWSSISARTNSHSLGHMDRGCHLPCCIF